MSVRVTVNGPSICSSDLSEVFKFTLQEFRGRIVFWKRCKKKRCNLVSIVICGRGRGVTGPHTQTQNDMRGATDVFQCSSFLADGYNGPDEDL